MATLDFEPRSGDITNDPQSLERWLDKVRLRLNIDNLNALSAPASGDEVGIFDVSAGVYLKITLANLFTGITTLGNNGTNVNWITVSGASTGNPPTIMAAGETNVSLSIVSKGTGQLNILTGGTGSVYLQTNGGVTQAEVYHTAGATNRVQMTGSNGGNPRIGVSGGNLAFANKIYPVNDAGAVQSASGLYAGTGAPTNANGADGDYYFRSDGGLATHIYFRSGGTWAGII